MLKAYVTGLIEQMDDIDAAYQKYKEIGYEVTTIQPEPNLPFYQIVADRFESINDCDLLVVVTKPDGTLGVGATYEVLFATYLHKAIKYIKGNKIWESN